LTLFVVLISVFSIALQDTIPPAERDTIPPALPDTLPLPVLPDTLLPAANDTIPAEAIPDTLRRVDIPVQKEEELIPIEFWRYRFSPSMDEAESDSTLRWVNMVNLFDRFHGSRGAITYRLGTTGRPDALDLHGYETRHLRVELEGLRLNDPLTGAVNWNRIPKRKILDFRESDFGATYRSQTRLKDFYLTQPRTYINFDESKHDYRNLDFVFTQNIQQNTNIEFSFWDRRDGGGYQRSSVEGRQAAALVWHQLSPNWMAKAMYLNNALDRNESFGYQVQEPAFFAFNRFIEAANVNNAQSNQTSSDIYLQAHYRPDPHSDVASEFGLHYQTDRWSLTYTADTLSTDFTTVELYARQHLGFGNTRITSTARAFYVNESGGGNISHDNWIGGNFDLELEQRFGSWSRINVYGMMDYWDDDRFSSEVSGRLTLSPIRWMKLSAFAGLLSRAPDIQSVYWQSNEFSGNSGLLNEETVTAGGAAEFSIGRLLTLGVRSDVRETQNAAFVDENNLFINADSYTQISNTGWLGLDSRVFEGEISATLKTYSSDSAILVNQWLDTTGDRMLISGNLYWKNYVFNKAAYVKAGFSGVFSPNAFRTAEFLPPLNRWQHGTNINRFRPGTQPDNQFYNPSYYRVDLDISARIRWFMLLIKWENLLDGVNQLGYFETTGYPMPERRFMLGLRILFTN